MQETCSGNPAHYGAEMLMIACRLFLIKTIQKQQHEEKKQEHEKGQYVQGTRKKMLRTHAAGVGKIRQLSKGL